MVYEISPVCAEWWEGFVEREQRNDDNDDDDDDDAPRRPLHRTAARWQRRLDISDITYVSSGMKTQYELNS